MTLIDVYQLLFGKDHIQDGDVISMSEHGRVGGLSTGTPFKAIQDVPNKTIIDETDGSALYLGEANHGAATSEAVWRIFKLVKSGAITTIFYADGSDKFDKEWDERTTYTYA